MEDYLFVTGASQNIKHSELDKNMAILEAYRYFLSTIQPTQEELINNYKLTNCTTVDYYLDKWIKENN